jgi:outer membrane protein OmpA-like peptidoglycan-associated protein
VSDIDRAGLLLDDRLVGTLPGRRRPSGGGSVKKIAGWGGRAAGAAVITAVTAGCGISGLSGPAPKPAVGPPLRVTRPAAPSAFVIVVGGRVAGAALSKLVATTARPGEELEIVAARPRPQAVTASSSPAPTTITVPGKPLPPGRGATTYQWALYRKGLKVWRSKVKVAEQQVAARTHADLLAWARRLRIPASVTAPAGAWANPNSLGHECKLAASAFAGLDQRAGDRFGRRRVVLLYAPNLRGFPRLAELAGDDVIVVTSHLPSATRASTAQAKLLDAGAASATILGPEATPAVIAQLVSAGLSLKIVPETLSRSVPFAADGTALLPGARRVLTSLIAALRRPGTVAVINGYTYAAGSAHRDYKLSLARAAAVARFFENHRIPASSLVVVGHGASRLVTPRSAGTDGRVLVVIEEPPTG